MEVGTIRTITQKYVRHECDCGEPARYCHTYLYPNARTNPQSKGYGRDNISWCSDHEEFTCADCPQPHVPGFDWCSTYDGEGERFSHMIHFFMEISREDQTPCDNEGE